MIETSYSNATATIDGTRVTVRHDPAVCAVNESSVRSDGTVSAASRPATRKPVGPFDDFTGPWQPGDRDPSGELQALHPEWFLNYPGKADNPTYSTSGSTETPTVAFVFGGVTQIGNDGPAPSTRKRRITGCIPGLTAFALGSFAAGTKLGVELASVGDARNVSGDFALSTEAGPVVGPSILWTSTGNTASAQIVVGPENAGKPLFLNSHQVSSNPEQLVQVAAY